ncbi:PQQ-dependent sugar dehydrogenase [Nocardioides sp. GXZ039]|uniref:PQQ-dependent sugar dehydrogenase n=1 Tax=Nocardioides sp. GXZ039 TaxID=3136018 RepID=UPI0030F43BC0
MRRLSWAVPAVVTCALLAGCGSDESDDPADEQSAPTSTSTPPPTTSEPSGPSGPSSTPGGESPSTAPSMDPTTIATDLEAPWGMDFFADGDAIVTERDTRRVLRVTPAGEVTELGVVAEAEPTGPGAEDGLLGVALSPTFERDRLVYLYFTTAEDNRVVRTTLEDDRLGTDLEVILDGIPNAARHDGGRLEFGPDGYLYISTGETADPPLAQDKESLGGKILRVTPDGDPAPGNPFGTAVYSYGHRNVQGLAFDDAGRLWASEFGDQTWDELNLIEAGGNYGWPEVEGKGGAPTYVDPQQTWATDDASPSGLAYADGSLWMASLRGERLWRVTVEGKRAVDPRDYFVGKYGRMRTIAVAPDGTLWFTTSNRDGRGTPAEGDDLILQIRPEA